MSLRSRHVTTGLDVGASSVKVVRLEHNGGARRLVGLALSEIRPHGYDGGQRRELNEVRVEAIRSAIAESGADPRDPAGVVTAVGGPNISIKHVAFPKMQQNTLAGSIQWEARKFVPFDTADFVLDFQMMDNAKEAEEMRVLLAAVERCVIDEHLSLLSMAGVEPRIVDLAPLALMNELEEEGLVEGRTVAVIEIGRAITNLSVYKRHGVLFARCIPMRSAPVLESSDREPGATEMEREDGESGENAQESADTLAGCHSAGGWADFVVEEVRHSLAFYDIESGKQGIEKVYLAGGRALVPGIADAFTEALGVPTEVLDPFEGLGDRAGDLGGVRQEGPRFALAMGLARRV